MTNLVRPTSTTTFIEDKSLWHFLTVNTSFATAHENISVSVSDKDLSRMVFPVQIYLRLCLSRGIKLHASMFLCYEV